MSLSGKKGSAQHFHEGNYTKIVQTCKRSWSTMFVESCDLDTPSINQGRVHDNMAFIYKQHLLCWNHSCLDNFLKIYPSQSQSSIPLLTLQVCPSSRAALWASTGLSMTRPVRPEKSMATKEFSDTLRCKETSKGGRVGGGWWAGGGGTQGWWWWWGGGGQGSEVKQARHSHWGMTNPVCRDPLQSTHAPLRKCTSLSLVSCSD